MYIKIFKKRIVYSKYIYTAHFKTSNQFIALKSFHFLIYIKSFCFTVYRNEKNSFLNAFTTDLKIS